jgi:hypothetical protein
MGWTDSRRVQQLKMGPQDRHRTGRSALGGRPGPRLGRVHAFPVRGYRFTPIGVRIVFLPQKPRKAAGTRMERVR